MTDKEITYSKAYVELIEILKRLPSDELNKIPKNYINNLNKYKSRDYLFMYDDTKSFKEQEFMTETQALFVDLYIRFIAPKDEQDFWKKYDKYCSEKIRKKQND